MDVLRRIGNFDILVDCNKAHDIFFEQISLPDIDLSVTGLSQVDICQILSEDEFRPLFLKWEITDKCNFSCPFCYIVGHSNNRIIRFIEVKPSIDILLEQGLLYCLITGGEALTHPDFAEIYLYLKMKGVIVEVYTNGAQLTDDHLILFLQYPPYKIEVTIYAISDSIFEKNTNSDSGDNRVLQNVLKLQDAGLNVICKTPINRLTMVELDEISNWCKSHGIDHYHSNDIAQAYDSDDLTHFTAPQIVQLHYSVENEKQFRSKHLADPGDKVKFSFSCSVGSYGILINSAFNLFPCGAFQGKITGFSIADLGIQSALKELRDFVTLTYKTPIVGCHGCEASFNCKMCPAIASEVITEGELAAYATTEELCSDILQEFLAIKTALS